jgi:predicted ATP-grasp superfamily ATP-dependent carboligase
MVDEPGFSEAAFARAVRDELARHSYLTVIPTSDAAILALGAAGAHLVDKASLTDEADRAGLPTPPTLVFPSYEDLLAAAGTLDYPVVIKPTISRWAPFRADAPEGAEAARGMAGPMLVQPFVGEPLTAVGGVIWREELLAAVHQRYLRTWPPECGTSSAAITVAPDADLEARITRLLHGYDGMFQVQLAGPFLLDVNPRPYGSMPLALAAGVNLPALYCDLLQGRDVGAIRGESGAFYRWVEGDLRRLWREVRTGAMGLLAAVRELRPRRGATHSTESLSDPGPMLARLRFAVSRQDRLRRRAS